MNTDTPQILRLPAVMHMTGLGRSSIYAFIKNETFPQSMKLGPKAVGWLREDIENWIQERTAESERRGS